MNLIELAKKWAATETTEQVATKPVTGQDNRSYADRLKATIQANDAIWAGHN